MALLDWWRLLVQEWEDYKEFREEWNRLSRERREEGEALTTTRRAYVNASRREDREARGT